MKTINVALIKEIDKSYKILIKNNLLKEIGKLIANDFAKKKILILCDTNTKSLYGNKLLASLAASGFDVYLYAFPAGEKNKNITTKLKIEDFMFKNKFGRDSMIIALGGGVVGDIGGFTASTFNRGIAYIQVPTSLLAQVDSSIGGKTAIDNEYGKNLIGTFYQPSMVIIDPLSLNTLPKKEYIAGLAEVIKHAIIKDKRLFQFIEDNIHLIKQKDSDTLEYIIETNCNIKRNIVEEDEIEGNIRRILNFGHTIGHSIEKLMDYKMLHGECVAVGMLIEARISKILGYLEQAEIERITALLKEFSLPCKIPANLDINEIYETTFLDKKAIQNKPLYSLTDSIGSMLSIKGEYGISVEKYIVMKALNP